MTRKIALLLLATVSVLLAPTTVSAQIPTVHELHLTPGVESIDLDLIGMGLAPSQGGYDVEIISPPAFGLLAGESYSPKSEMWAAGLDQMTLEIQPLDSSPITQHTFVLVPANPILLRSSEEEFEAPTLPPGATQGNSTMLSLVNPGIEGQSLLAYLHTAGASADFGVPHPWPLPDSDGNHGIGAAGTTIPGPPDNVVPGSINIATAGPPGTSSSPEIYVQLRMREEPPGNRIYEMRAATAPNGDPQCPTCATPWNEVTADQPIRYELWAGPTVIDSDGGRDFALRFSLDRPYPDSDTVDWLPGVFNIEQARHGFHQPTGMTYLEAMFDNLSTWVDSVAFDSQIEVHDHFEDTYAASPWTAAGPILVNGNGAIHGLWGAEADASQLRSGTPRDALLMKTPAAPQTGLVVDMQLDVSKLKLTNGESMRLFAASADPAALDVTQHLSIVLSYQGNAYKVWARARDNAAVVHKTTTYTLLTETPRLTMTWRADDAASGGGSIALFVDGVSAGESSGFDNSGNHRLVENLGFGIFNPTLTPISAYPPHLLHMDNLLVLRKP